MSVTASCHCGGYRLEIPQLPEETTSCNCSWCSRVGGLWGYYPPEDVTMVAHETDRIYDPNDMNRHLFCSVCSCLMYNDTPVYDFETHQDTGKRQFSVNLRMVEDADVASLPVCELDGKHDW